MRVLHIGNIANNGYNNAKILNKYDIESDVLSPRYYHVMGCSEWEDADFRGNYGDDNLPNWSDINLNGFTNPEWFLKGSEILIVKYLLHRNKKNIFLKMLFKNLILIDNLLYQRKFWLLRKIKTLILIILKRFQNHKNLFLNKSNLINRIMKNNHSDIYMIINKLNQALYNDFKERHCKLNINHLYNYQNIVNLYKELFEYYDIVIGYGVDGMYPLLAGKKYIAFEHGTIRNLPFQNNDLGLQALLAYKYADSVIITNADNIQAAKKLGLKNYMFIPHPINESPLKLLSTMDFDNLYEKYNTDFIAFHPSRQHWEKDIRHPDWEKGNDIFIEGFAKFVKEVNPKAKSIFIEWGQKVEESKELIKELRIEDNIIWIKPMHNYAMIRVILSSDVVADQFYLGSFGGITPKAMMYGKPAMLYLNESLHNWCFDELPPVLNTATSDDVFAELTKLYTDKNFVKKISFDSKEWYMKYHSNELIKDRLVDMIHKVLNSNEVEN